MTDQFNTHPQPRTFAPSKEGKPLSNSNVEPQTDSRLLNEHACAAHRCPSEPAILLRCARVAGKVRSRTQTTRPHALTFTLSAGSRTTRSTTPSPIVRAHRPFESARPAHPAAASSQTSRTPMWGKTLRVRRRRHPLPCAIPLTLCSFDVVQSATRSTTSSSSPRSRGVSGGRSNRRCPHALTCRIASCAQRLRSACPSSRSRARSSNGTKCALTSVLCSVSRLLSIPDLRISADSLGSALQACPTRASLACRPRCAVAIGTASSAG